MTQPMKFGKDYYDYCKKENNFDMNAIGGWQHEYFKFLQNVFKEHMLKSNKFLDVGAATGNYLELFRLHGFEMFGCDVSDWYLDATPFKEIKSRLGVIVNNKVPFDDDKFDFVHMCQVIEHIPELDIYEELTDIKRTMKDGAILYVSTVGEGPEIPEEGQDPTHISCFSEEKWNKIFNEVGFTIVTDKYTERFKKDSFAKNYPWVNFVLVK